jgi:hypothetical protein
MTHRMILATADLSKVYKVVVAKRKHAPLAQQEEQRFRTPQTGVQGVDGAPQDSESSE